MTDPRQPTSGCTPEQRVQAIIQGIERMRQNDWGRTPEDIRARLKGSLRKHLEVLLLVAPEYASHRYVKAALRVLKIKVDKKSVQKVDTQKVTEPQKVGDSKPAKTQHLEKKKKPPLKLLTQRPRAINGQVVCAKCRKVAYCWRFKNTTWGEIALCERCIERVKSGSKKLDFLNTKGVILPGSFNG